MEGYEKLAKLVSTYSGIDMYRKFAALHGKSLLYMQAELTHLEAQLSDIMGEDFAYARAGDTENELFPFSWMALKESIGKPGGDLQYRLVMEIRAALKEYCMFLQLMLPRMTTDGYTSSAQMRRYCSKPKSTALAEHLVRITSSSKPG